MGVNVADIANEIVAREGGFVNDPVDPGGATNYGVTIGTLRALGLDKTGAGGSQLRTCVALETGVGRGLGRKLSGRLTAIDLLPLLQSARAVVVENCPSVLVGNTRLPNSIQLPFASVDRIIGAEQDIFGPETSNCRGNCDRSHG